MLPPGIMLSPSTYKNRNAALAKLKNNLAVEKMQAAHAYAERIAIEAAEAQGIDYI
jgi:hypothetical protein